MRIFHFTFVSAFIIGVYNRVSNIVGNSVFFVIIGRIFLVGVFLISISLLLLFISRLNKAGDLLCREEARS